SLSQKFAFAQISQHWRDFALKNPVFWSTIMVGDSESRLKLHWRWVPLALERSGSSTMLHIYFDCTDGRYYADAIEALRPCVHRIQTLEMRYYTPPHPRDLLASNLQFPALRVLRVYGAHNYHSLRLSLTAPQLQALEVGEVESANLHALFVPSLEDIELYRHLGSVNTLANIFQQCPRVRRVVLSAPYDRITSPDADFEAFSRRPLALRHLELEMEGDLIRVLRAGFSHPDNILHTLGIRVPPGASFGLLADALLVGVDSIILFDLIRPMELQLRDEQGRVRRLLNDHQSVWKPKEVWTHLSLRYNLHKTVREIRVNQFYWDDIVDLFALYPLGDGPITFRIEVSFHAVHFNKPLHIPALSRVEFTGRDTDTNPMYLQQVLGVLAKIQPPAARKVEVCVLSKKLRVPEKELEGIQDASIALEKELSGTDWAICTHSGRCMYSLSQDSQGE
ncbi:hypothetical protein B0H16DRAFT_1309867, partial [Mycena metata]